MKSALMLALIALLALPVLAQNAPIPTQTFSFNAQAISLPGARGTFAGTDAGVSFQPTPNLALQEANVLSSDAKLADFLGLVSYQFPFLSKVINNQTPTVSGFRLRLGVRAGGGIARVKDNSGNVAQHFSALAQGTFAYSFDGGGTYQLGGNVGVMRVPGYAKGWTPVVELGPQFHF